MLRLYIKLFALLGFISILQGSDVFAQTDWWSRVDGPYGGTTVWDLVELDNGQVLAATSNGVYASPDQGDSWDGMSTGLTSFDVRDIIQTSDGTVWAATFGRGLFRWDVAASRWDSGGLGDTYLTTLYEPRSGVLLAGGNSFVYRSDTAGSTWASHTLDGFAVNVQHLSGNSTHIFAGSNLGIFRSTDEGQTWEFSSLGLQEYNTLTIATSDEGHVFAGMQPGSGGCALYRSRGNGNLWTCIQPATDPQMVPMLEKGSDGSIYAGGFRNLYKSFDDGTSWTTRRTSGSNVQSLLIMGSRMLVGTHGQGILQSTDGGANWVDSNQGLQSGITTVRYLNDGRVVAGTRGGLFQTRDLGQSWTRVDENLPLIQEITDVALDTQGRMIAASKAGVWRLDPEEGWSALGPPGMPSIRDVDVTPDGTILAGYHAGVWIHSGSTWVNSLIKGPDQASRDVGAVHMTASGALLAGSAWDSWRRAAGSPDWQLMGTDALPWFDIQALAEHDGRILAGTKFAGVMQSWDNGLTWNPAGSGLGGSEDVRDVQFDPFGTPYIGTYGSGIYQLNPWSRTWLPVNGGLEGHFRVTSLAFDGYGNAYAGTVDGGLYSHVTRGVSTEDTPSIASSAGLGAPWPNPATDRINLPIDLRQSGEVELRIVDLLGRERHIDVRFMPSGLNNVTVDLPRVSPGVYFVQLKTDGLTSSRSFTVMN